MDIRPIDANALKQHQKMLVEHMDGYDVAYNAVPMHRVDDAPTLSLNTLRDAIYQDAVAHGLWENWDFPSDCAWLISQEASELCDAGTEWEDDGWYDGEENATFSEELADVIIMSMSVAGKLGIDIDAAIRRKMEINKGRAWKHGKE